MAKISTKKALIMSMLSMLLCVSMLVGSTFAWFTDTASTTVNSIQAGTLDVELWKADSDAKLDATALTWVKAEGHTDESVLWEPGCTYNLESFRIKNNGNLALKYQVVISGLIGSAKLLEAIDFTVKIGDADPVALANWDGTLEAGAVTDKITISGTMKTTAGNEYQNETIDGIAITVVATQLNKEYDSTDNTYDSAAEYPVYVVEDVAVNSEKKTTAATTITSTQKVGTTDTALATATVPADVLTTSGENATSIPMALSINEVATTSANFTVEVADTHVAKTLEVTMTNLAAANTTPIIVTMYVGAGLSGFKLYHNSTEMTAVDSAAEVDTDQEYYYDSTTGIVTMATATFSPFTYTYKKPVGVSTFAEFIDALSAAEAGDTIKLNAVINPTTNFNFDKSITIDMNGYGFVRGKEASGGYEIEVQPGCDLTMKNGSWTIAEDAGFGKITVCNDVEVDATTTTNEIVFENVNFINLKPVTATGSSSNGVEEVVKVSMKKGMTVNATFTNCSFKNAKVMFSSFDSGKNTFHAVFEGCKFNNLGNTSAIQDSGSSDYKSDNCSITVNNCTFNIESTSGVTIVEGKGNDVNLTFTNNKVNGSLADSSKYKVASWASVKVHSGEGYWGFKSVTYSNNTLSGIVTEK